MAKVGSPCGACKFVRRKCVRGCAFVPFFCHEQGASHFAAIHKMFGASNLSKLLANLPVGERCESAITISYEAQARLRDPIYGCVSHIFALQQQVFSLQAQVACLKEQASQSLEGQNSYSPHQSPPDREQYCRILGLRERLNGLELSRELSYLLHDPGRERLISCFDEVEGSISPFDDLRPDNSHRWSFRDSKDHQSVAFGHSIHH